MKPPTHLTPARRLILALTLLGLALGGSTDLWAQTLITIFAGLLIFFVPPKRDVGRLPVFLFVALFLLALAAFLPAAWSTNLPWRERLTTTLGISLAPTRTPQPWLTAQACGLLFIALAWSYYVLSQRWTSELRLQATRILVFGVAVLAAVALAAFAGNFHVPMWNQEENRGWFPNRNQTADVLAICAVINYAMIFDCLRKRLPSLYLWLCTMAVLAAALVVSYSRAGILMFFGGVALWHIWPSQRPQRPRSAAKWTALSVALVFVLLTLFFLFGGETLARFDGSLQSAADNRFRWAIQQDALRFSLQSPLLGVGLGNFEPLFASAREASANADRALHPESDWLWAAAELGWLAPCIFVIGIGWWLRRCLPFVAKPGESLRRALTVGGILFILHGFVDVSAHRIGSMFVGLLVFSLAMPNLQVNDPPESKFRRNLFRGVAFAMLLVGASWAVSGANAPLPATTATLETIEKQIDDALVQNRLAKMETLATAGLAIAPLDWHLYFQRAYAETFQPGGLSRAGKDFLVARSLESKWVKPCFDEGATWLAAGQPDLCMDAWEEALRRTTSPVEALTLYREMLELARSNDLVHADLQELAAKRIDYQLVFLDFASNDETRQLVTALLAEDPNLRALDRDHRQALFTAWWNQGDREALVTALAAHPDWVDAGWVFLAQAHAGRKDFQGAWAIVAHYAPTPPVPGVSTTRSLEDLQSEFYDREDNLAAGLQLYVAQNAQGKTEEALTTLRAMEKSKTCPKYVYYLEAKMWAAKQQWELAWNAWWNFYAT